MEQHLLSLIIFLPLLASVLVLSLPASWVKSFRWITLVTTLVQGALSLRMWQLFDTGTAAFQLVEEYDWISLSLGSFGRLSIDYLVGVDGFSFPMVLLSALVLAVGALASWRIMEKARGYFALYLLLSSTVMGCFAALDFFLFYLFFEFMLLPMYFLIGLWGGPRKEYASIKFFLYTFGGSLFILLAMIGLYLSVVDPIETAGQTGNASATVAAVQQRLSTGTIPATDVVHTFDLRAMMDRANYLPGSILGFDTTYTLFMLPARLVAFLFVFLGFAIKMPIVPFHTWLPDAHVEAPTPVSVVLAGILLKIGSYGFFRITYSLFPEGSILFGKWIALLGVISILYGAFNALAMNDLKKMIAYSSVSHMGFVLIGLASLTPEGVSGAIYQSFSHGVLSSMLFLLVGALYDRTHDRRIDSYQGLGTPMPQYTALVTVAFFASLGLPGFSGFIGELFSLMGSFHTPVFPRWLAVLATLGIVLSAAYFLWALQRVFFGKLWLREPVQVGRLTDLTGREKWMLVPLAILAIVFGLFPSLLFDLTNATVSAWVKRF